MKQGKMKTQSDLQNKYDELLQEFKAGSYKGASPNNEVHVAMGGTAKLKSVVINDSFDASNKRLLEALLIIAVNEATDAYSAAYAKYNRDCDKAYADHFKNISNETIDRMRPKGVLGWDLDLDKKIDGEEN